MEWWSPIQLSWRAGGLALAEILLLFAVLYAVLRFLRGSQGAPVLRGILLLIGLSIGIVFFAANWLGLEHIQWVFEKLAALFFVGLLIVFQPELRRGLVRLGLKPVLQRFVRTGSPAIEELVKAVRQLSQDKTGALLAIERQAPLTSYIEAGTPLNAEITAALLQTIFYKGTALHDGAVIVRGTRIAAANCLFSLSENPELSKTLGTRHRAAVGLTEENDAVTVVVSEETGRIALGVDGRLQPNLSPEELRRRLIELCLEILEGAP